MGYEVDTDEVRRAAAQIKKIAASVRQLSTQNVRTMQSSVDENLNGEAADALKNVLDELSMDISKIGNGLDAIQKALYEYAKRVEAADAAAEQAIRNR